MKKIISIVLLLSLVACALVACKKDEAPAEKTYTLSIAVDEGLKTVSRGKVTNIALALLTDADGKIVAARFDCIEAAFKLNADSTDVVTTARFDTKVEQGDNYSAMGVGPWYKQAKAFEDFLVGKTAAEVEALDTSAENVQAGNLVAGCTMTSSTPVFQALVKKAFAYERKGTFTTAETVTLGIAIDGKLTGSLESGKVTVAADYAAVAVAGGKVVASMLDSAEAKYNVAVAEGALTTTLSEYKGTKNEQGDAYDAWQPMDAGRWYAQAQAYANSTVGKTAAELKDIPTTGVSGCTIATEGYKAVLVRAAGYVR